MNIVNEMLKLFTVIIFLFYLWQTEEKKVHQKDWHLCSFFNLRFYVQNETAPVACHSYSPFLEITVSLHQFSAFTETTRAETTNLNAHFSDIADEGKQLLRAYIAEGGFRPVD